MAKRKGRGLLLDLFLLTYVINKYTPIFYIYIKLD